MRIALISNYPVDPDFIPGGVPAVGHYMTRGLAARDDIDLHVVCCQGDVAEDHVCERDGATIHFLTDRTRFSQAQMLRPQRKRIAAVLRDVRPDLVHAQGLGLPTMATLDSGLPNLVTVHGIFWKEQDDRYNLTHRIGSIIRRRSALNQIRSIRNVVITSRYAGEVLPADVDYRTWVIRNPVGAEIFAIENEPTTPHVLVVGGLRRRKAPMTSMRVMQRVLREVPDATLHLLGPDSGTELDDEVRAFIRDNGMAERVKLLGLVSREDLWNEYRRASLLFLPSLEETAPVALGEACAVGLPAVGSDAGGIPDMIADGETGYVRTADDVPALAEAVIDLLRNRERRDQFARNNAERGRREFVMEAVAEATAGAYRELLAEAGHSEHATGATRTQEV